MSMEARVSTPVDGERPTGGDELPSFSRLDEDDMNAADDEPTEALDRAFDGRCDARNFSGSLY